MDTSLPSEKEIKEIHITSIFRYFYFNILSPKFKLTLSNF